MVVVQDALMVNSWVRQALISTQEVIGAGGLEQVLQSASLERYIRHFPPDNLLSAVQTSEYAHFQEVLEDIYGRKGRALLQQIGKVSFHYALGEDPILVGLALRLMPPHQRLQRGLTQLLKISKKNNPKLRDWVQASPDGRLAYVDRTCGVCYGRKSDAPLCHYATGMVSEAVVWAMGIEYEVCETHCIGRGDEYCRFEVGRPIG